MLAVCRTLVYSRFGLNRCLCSQYTGFWFIQGLAYFMFAVYRILVYSRFGLDRFLCALYTGFWFIQGLV